MMISRREEEKNEKIIRGLMKLPPNRKCINCNSLGPQYVCTNFWTFVCMACSGIHREFTHRVKSVSLAKFNKQEVDDLQNGGNQRAKEVFLKGWDTERMRLPNSSNPDSIRDFIKSVYIEKRYAYESYTDKPHKNALSLEYDEDQRRASSYHSFSQSPPYDHQYEDRRYGKQSSMLSRKSGSDQAHFQGRVPTLVNSTGSLREQMYEDRFAIDTSSRTSDYSVSSTGDTFKSDGQSPKEFLVGGQSDILNRYSEANMKSYAIRTSCLMDTSTSGSFGSSSSNTVSLNAVLSGSLVDTVSRPDSSRRNLHTETSIPSLSCQKSVPVDLMSQDLFSQPYIQSALSVDLFAGFTSQASSSAIPVEKPDAFPLPENAGWATFDFPQHPMPQQNIVNFDSNFPADGEKVNMNGISSLQSTSKWPSVQNLVAHGMFQSTTDLPVVLNDVKVGSDPIDFKSWNAFDEPTNSIASPSVNSLSQNIEPVSIPVDSHTGLHFSKVETSQLQKAPNPFDLPFDQELETNDLFLGMSALQAALPSPDIPPTFYGSLPQPFFSSTTFCVNGAPFELWEGSTFTGEQAPSTQLQRNVSAQANGVATDGNPFS